MEIFEGNGKPMDIGNISTAKTGRQNGQQRPDSFAAIEKPIAQYLKQKVIKSI